MPYAPEEFSTYHSARRAALPSLGAFLGAGLEATGQVRGAALVGSVLIMPAAPVGDLPAFRSDRDPRRRTYVCHTKPGRPENENQCDFRDVCAAGRCD